MIMSRTMIAVPPGETIREQLDYKGIGMEEFAAQMNFNKVAAIRLIEGEMQITREIAAKLEAVLGPPAEFWRGLESLYRDKIIKIEIENSRRTDTGVDRTEDRRQAFG